MYSCIPVIYLLFQSSLELSPECNLDATWESVVYDAVSILTRAFARVQPPWRWQRCAIGTSFNPHSSFRPSATSSGSSAALSAHKFQSSLELSPECNEEYTAAGGALVYVSILTRAFARVQRFCPQGLLLEAGVSILTRAFARVQHIRGGICNPTHRFQSSLELSPECNLLRNNNDQQYTQQVSILTRAFARVQRPHSSVRAGQGSRSRLREPPQKGPRRRVGEGEGKTGFQCPLADFSACANPPRFWHLLGVRA